MAEEAHSPLEQFSIHPIGGPIHIGGLDVSFTNSALWMVIAVGAITAFMLLGTRKQAIVPGRWQSLCEGMYDFVSGLLKENVGNEGRRFFPFVFSLFMFVLVANMFGMIPFFFTVTSHIIITFALAMLVFLVVIAYGFYRNGFKFLKLFVPAGVPAYVLPIVVPIEVVSFLSRPVSLSVRLFANMMAGHIALKVFAGFVTSLGALGVLGIAGAILPLIMAIALTGLEFLVAFLQAYVFAVLTCMYLNDALHPSH